MVEALTFAVTNGDLGGGEVMALRHAEAARDLGHPVTVVGPASPAAVVDAAAAAGFPTVAVRAGDRRTYLRALRSWDRHERRGLLWAHGLLPSFATAGHGRRIVHLHQDPRSRAQRACFAVARRSVALVVVPSHSMAARLPGTKALPNWTPDLRVPHRTREAVPTVGFLGRMSQDKGLDVLAHAVAGLTAAEEVRLLVAGDSRYVQQDQRDAVGRALRHLGGSVRLAGHIGREEFLGQVDLAVFPSVWPEPFGLVVAEAMAARVPFVVSDAGALPEVAGPEHPWVARAGDPDDLRRAIVGALAAADHPEVEAGRGRWEREYSPHAGLQRVRDVLIRVGAR